MNVRRNLLSLLALFWSPPPPDRNLWHTNIIRYCISATQYIVVFDIMSKLLSLHVVFIILVNFLNGFELKFLHIEPLKGNYELLEKMFKFGILIFTIRMKK